MELDSKSPELWQERQPWARGVKSPVGFRVVLKDDAGNCRQVIRAAWRQRAPVSSQSSRGSQNLLDLVGGRLHTVCCWLHQKRRVRPSESIWEFPPFIFPWTLTTFQKATSLNTVFWVCSPICLLLSYALLLGTTPVSAASLARSPKVFSLEELCGSSTEQGISSSCTVSRSGPGRAFAATQPIPGQRYNSYCHGPQESGPQIMEPLTAQVNLSYLLC